MPSIEDCAKDGGEEFFTEMHCVRITNVYSQGKSSVDLLQVYSVVYQY